MFDWNDLRFFLAVARTGSTLAAAAQLKVSQPTTARRIAALESTVGFKLFERGRWGSKLTDDGAELLPFAERMEAEAEALANAVAARTRVLSGAIRVTTNESMANIILAPAMRKFAKLHPDVQIQLAVDDRRLDLARGEADVALRAGSRPADPSLVGRLVGRPRWSVYCSRDYAASNGLPTSYDDLNNHAVIGGEGGLASIPGMVWLRSIAPRARVVWRSNSVTNLCAAIKAGLGVGTLPCMLEDAEPELVRCFAPVTELDSELWLITHERLRRSPRVRAFMDFMADYVTAIRPMLAGEADNQT